MSDPNIKIESDFTDYYDSLSCNDGSHLGVYSRFMSDMPSKGKGLSRLRALGIQTIETKAVREIIPKSGKVVVYINPSDHSGEGKALMNIEEARLMYPNSLASEYIPEADGVTNKLLQVGTRRFRVILKDDTHTLKKGRVIKIDEISPAYNIVLGLPIYSIDYIPTANGLLAITLNTVERLSDYNIQDIMTSKQVMEEVYKALIKYNKL